jgi:hypothetical protein
MHDIVPVQLKSIVAPKTGDDLGIFQRTGEAERSSINAPIGSINRLSGRRTADGVRQAATLRSQSLSFAAEPDSTRLERGVTIRHRARKIEAARKA